MTTKIPLRALPQVLRPGAVGRAPTKTSFKPGKSGNPNGRPPNSPNKNINSDVRKLRTLISTSGMTPLEFLTFAYRNQLFDKYVEKLADDGRTVVYEPDPKAKQIDVPLQLRVTCAQGAAPYVHKKMPVGIEVKEKNAAVISTDKLRSMKTEDLGKLLDFMDRFGLSLDLASTAEVGEAEGDDPT